MRFWLRRNLHILCLQIYPLFCSFSLSPVCVCSFFNVLSVHLFQKYTQPNLKRNKKANQLQRSCFYLNGLRDEIVINQLRTVTFSVEWCCLFDVKPELKCTLCKNNGWRLSISTAISRQLSSTIFNVVKLEILFCSGNKSIIPFERSICKNWFLSPPIKPSKNKPGDSEKSVDYSWATEKHWTE